jgi:hypothetical protein
MEDEDPSTNGTRVSPEKKSVYTKIIERLFEKRFDPAHPEILISRDDLVSIAAELGLPRPKNVGDLPYTFRYRQDFPASVAARAPTGTTWVFWPAGRSKYRLAPAKNADFPPSPHLAETKVPNSTPGMIAMYSRTDEQALLARLRYNRLIDVFTGVTTYSLQSHWRTFVKEFGQLETDELYVGIDRRGAQYVFPVQAKGRGETLHVVQVAQDFAACQENFPALICRPIGAQFLEDDVIALLEFEGSGTDFHVSNEKHYRLVIPSQVSESDLATYAKRPL